MKILRLEIENYKRLKAVEITPKGNIIQVTGRNANGKSSVLDSIWSALGGATHIQAEPIRKGTNKARIKLDLGELVVTRGFTKSGTTLTVENAEGLAFKSPQKMLDALVGALAFDPLEFVRMKARDQFDTLKSLAKVDLDLDKIDAENKRDYDRRTDINRDAKSLRVQADAVIVPKEPAGVEDVSTLMDALEGLRGAKNEAESFAHRRQECEQNILTKREIFQRKRDELVAIKAEITALEEELGAIPEPESTETLDSRIAEIEEHVRHSQEAAKATAAAAAAKDRKKNLEEMAGTKEKESESLTQTMAAREKAKQDAIAKAKMPIPDLGFGEGVVLYKGVPFDQASSAEQLKVSTAIAMAANPKLRVIRITDGSLLDEDSLAMMAEMAQTNDFQIWLEQVDSTGKIGVVISDGEVVADNQGDGSADDCKTDGLNYIQGPTKKLEPLPSLTEVLTESDTQTRYPTAKNLDDKLDRDHSQGLDLDIP